MDYEGGHLDTERFQALLDGGLPTGEARAAEAHVASCGRCRAEFEAWQTLFHELDGLEEVAPSRGFAERVLGAIPAPEPRRAGLAGRVEAALQRLPGRGSASTDPRRHVAPGRLQDFLEGLLAPAAAASVEGHLEGCRFCRDEAAAWRSVMGGLEHLPRLAPSPEFPERVMAHVRVQTAAALARPTVRERLLGLAGAISPTTRKRAAGLAGAMVTPGVTLALMVYTVFSHPLVTVGTVASFFWLEVQELSGRLVGSLLGSAPAEGMVESVALFRAWSLLANRSPATTAAVLALVGVLTLVALWVLYRNLFATEPVDGRHAHFTY